jgi:UDP-3-O-[3-hydroxymyristoyl] glucosamine N-acyltransferase
LEIENTKNMGQLKACVAVVNEDILIEPGDNRAFIKVNADLAMSQVLEMFAHPMPVFSVDIHPTVIYCCDG